MFCLAGTVTLFDDGHNQFIEQSATVSTVKFPTGSFGVFTGLEHFFLMCLFVVPSFQVTAAILCSAASIHNARSPKERERGREKRKHTVGPCCSHISKSFLSFILGSHHYLLCTHNAFLSFELSFPLFLCTFSHFVSLVSLSLSILTSPFSLNSAVTLGFSIKIGCCTDK